MVFHLPGYGRAFSGQELPFGFGVGQQIDGMGKPAERPLVSQAPLIRRFGRLRDDDHHVEIAVRRSITCCP